MHDRDRENLAELIERLFHGEQAEGVMQDIREGDRILRDNPAPEPDQKLITQIKAQIAMRLPTLRVQTHGWWMYKKTAAAAAIFIILGIITTLSHSPSKVRKAQQYAFIIPTSIWQSNDIAVDDENLAAFNTEIDQIESEVKSLESGDDGGSSAKSLDEMEIELIDVSNDFWKE